MPAEDVWLLRSEARFRAVLSVTLLFGVVIFAVVAVVFVAAFAMPTEAIAPTHHWVLAGHPDGFDEDAPRFFKDGPFWLVKRPDGTFLALRAVDNHYRRCPIEWKSSLVYFDATLQRETKGTLRSDCTSSNFTLDGTRIRGLASRDLDRYPVSISAGGRVVVDIADNLIMKGGQSSSSRFVCSFYDERPQGICEPSP